VPEYRRHRGFGHNPDEHDVHGCRSRRISSRCIEAQNELRKSSRCFIMLKVRRLKILKASCQEDKRHRGIEASRDDWQSIDEASWLEEVLSSSVDERYDGQQAYLLLLHWLRLQLAAHRLADWITYSWPRRTMVRGAWNIVLLLTSTLSRIVSFAVATGRFGELALLLSRVSLVHLCSNTPQRWHQMQPVVDRLLF